MTQDEIIHMARQVGFYGHSENFFDCTRKQIEAFAKLVAAKEREVILDMVAFYGGPVDLVDAIRARGETTSKG